MSKRKAVKAKNQMPNANGMKLARELMGLILLFFSLYLLLSLVTFDAHDPGFNHAISTAKGVHNSAGVIGSYLSGMLTDIFGVAAYIWPAFFLILAVRQLFFRFSVQWWRCLGFVCLLLCFMMAGTAWEFQLGDIVGGGFIGNTIYGITWKFLSGTGSFLLGLCFFLISLQLMFNLSWLALLGIFWAWIVSCWNDMRVKSDDADGPDSPDDTPPSLPEKGTGKSSDKNSQSKTSLIQTKQVVTDIRTKTNITSADATQDEDFIIEAVSEPIAQDDSQSYPTEITEKTNLWSRIKTTLANASKKDKAPVAAVNPLANPEQNADLEAFLAEHADANVADTAAETPPVLVVQNAPSVPSILAEQGSAQHAVNSTQNTADEFLQEDNACPNPFAAPWARACDIQADWAQPAVQVAENIEPTVADTANTVGPNGGLLVHPDVMETAPEAIETSSNADEFVFDSFQENAQVIDIIDNQQKDTPDFEIDLDATMAVQSDAEAFAFDDGEPESVSENDIQDHGHDQAQNCQDIEATLRELQNVLDMPAVAQEKSAIADDYVEAIPEIIPETAPEMVTEDAPNLDEALPEDELPEGFPPSFEVLMDADKDGITDLTEEEVGTGGAAKAAPIKVKTRLPHLDLLQDVVDDEYSKPRLDILTEKGERLTKCLADFGIQGELTRITPGPVVTMFEFRPAPGVKVSRIANLSDDLALALKAIAVRIQAPIPGTDTVGIEIPNEMRETIYFKDLLASETFSEATSLLTLAVGKDSAGRPSVADLAKMPHLLVAGATGAGKSVCLNSILLSFLYKARPEDVQLLLIDPKRIELAVYADLPHLVHPVVTDMSHAKNALDWAVHEMDKRYEGMARLGVRNIAGYNQKLEAFGNDKPIELLDLEFMPYLVIIIDELADLMLTAAKEVETSIVRLAQLARAAGIHMVLATQRPSVDVVTGLIKANFPCRISFQVTSKHDSRTILDTVGAEHLLGRGDMLFKPSGGRLQRLHGAFVSDDEVANVVEFWKRQQSPMYRVDFAQWGCDATQEGLEGGAGALADDPIYNDAVDFVLGQGQASISLIQRRFRIGFNKAARYVEQMEFDGIVGPANGSKPRPVLQNKSLDI